MGSKAFLFLLGLCLAISFMLSSEVVARELAETDSKKSGNVNAVHEAQYGGYPGGGYPGGGYPGGGYPGGGYPGGGYPGGGYPGGGRGGGGYPGGGRGGGGYPGGGRGGGGYPGGGRGGGGRGGGGRGGYCRYGCCSRNYYGCRRCCSYKGEAMDKVTEAEPHN